jgi:hypothetical protein
MPKNEKFDPNEEETCVHCGKGLGYKKGLDVPLRHYYVDGHGSHCKDCYSSCPFANLFIEG